MLKLYTCLEIVRIKGKESWQVYDVIAQLSTDPNTFFLINNNDIVVLVKQDDLLWSWCFYAEGGGAYIKYMDNFIEFAKQLGCTRIGFKSERPAYQKICKSIGAKVCRVEYEIDINSYKSATSGDKSPQNCSKSIKKDE